MGEIVCVERQGIDVGEIMPGGTVGAVECDTLPLFEGTIRSIIFLALWVLALLLLGEEHITIETVEKDRYAITTKRNGPNPKEKN